MLEYISTIMEKVGKIDYYIQWDKKPELRKQTLVNSIYSSLSIENNPLSLKQVEDIIEGNVVFGKQKDIQEVKNAYNAYEQLDSINPYELNDLKKIHGIMTFLILENNGKFRNHGEAVYNGDKCIFVAPPQNMVPELMQQLFDWLNKAKEKVHPLILSSVFHYELLFIHPFTDGNGRMSRLWQTAILSDWKEIFKYMPIENLIKKNQQEYYYVINQCDKCGDSNKFIEFMLKMIDETLTNLLIDSQEIMTKGDINKDLYGINDTDKIVLDFIKDKGIVSTTEIAKYIKKTDRTARRIVSKLEEKGLITWVGLNEKDPGKKYKLK